MPCAQRVADNNNLSVGDQVITRLYFTNAKETPNWTLSRRKEDGLILGYLIRMEIF